MIIATLFENIFIYCCRFQILDIILHNFRNVMLKNCDADTLGWKLNQ